MPNWVNNTIQVEGSKDDVESFITKLTAETEDTLEGRVSFRNFVESSNGNDWLESNVRNWGTKWDACDDEYEIQGGAATIHFQTAWDIPTPIWVAMVSQFSKLDFYFDSLEEEGWGKKFYSEAGELILDEEWEIPTSHGEWLKRNDECPVCLWNDVEDLYSDCPKDDDEQ